MNQLPTNVDPATGELLPVVAPSVEMTTTDPAVAAAAEREKARLQMAFFIAATRPRNELQARATILENCRRREFAVRAMYAKPVGAQKIEDLNIRFVEMALKEWRNVLTEASTVYEDERGRRVRVSAMDLQTNTSFTREVFIPRTVERARVDEGRTVLGQRKNTRGQVTYKLLATDDEMELATNSAISKALRNEGGRLLPEDLKDEARGTIRWAKENSDVKDVQTYRRSIVDAFTRLGIKPEDLERLLGHSIATTTVPELTNLETIYHSLQSGESTWAEWVPEDGALPLAERLAAQKEKIAGSKPTDATSPTGSTPQPTGDSTSASASSSNSRRTSSAKPSAEPSEHSSMENQEPPVDDEPPEADPIVRCNYCQGMSPASGTRIVNAKDGKQYRMCRACETKQREAVERAKAQPDPKCYFCGVEFPRGTGGDFKMPDGTFKPRCDACQKKMDAASTRAPAGEAPPPAAPPQTLDELRGRQRKGGKSR